MPRVEPVPGNDLYTTLDARLQRVAAQSFPDSLRGAVVALDPRTGEVLVMLSNPAVDPNIFSLATSIRSKNWVSIVMDPALPLNNRATCGTYTPGSTFKLVSSIAGLASGQMTRESRMPAPCHGAYRIGARVAHCWELKGHGYLNLIDAVAKSCDIYFYQVGLKLGDNCINKYALELGLGEKTGIELPAERDGWLSGEEAYNARWKKRGWVWTRGLLLDMAIGQTQVVTPLQLALMVGGLGNGHTLYRPFLVKEERNQDGIVLKQRQPVVHANLNFPSEIIETIHEAMASVIKAGGTGGWARVPGINVGGKTGSAEVIKGEKTHALFVSCAPVEDPVIAVSVVLEMAGHGGSLAAPIAGDIMRYYFAHTEEGRNIVRKYNPGIDSNPAMIAKIWPDDAAEMKKKVQAARMKAVQDSLRRAQAAYKPEMTEMRTRAGDSADAKTETGQVETVPAVSPVKPDTNEE